jgi:hypothetical protein
LDTATVVRVPKSEQSVAVRCDQLVRRARYYVRSGAFNEGLADERCLPVVGDIWN